MRRSSGQFGDDGRKRRFRPASKRVAGADVDHDELVGALHSRRLESTLDVSLGLGVRYHFYGIPCAVRPAGGPSVNRLEEVPLVDDRVSPSKFPRPWHRSGVHPRATIDFVPDSFGRSRQPGEPRAPRAAVQIDHQIVMIPSQSSRQPEIVDYSRKARAAWGNNHFLQVRILSDDGQCCRFDQICEPRLRQSALQRPEHRRGKDDVADKAQANQEDFHCNG